MSEIRSAKISIDCPACGSSFDVTLGDVQDGRLVTCPRGHRVQLQEKGNGIGSADQALDNFTRSLDDLKRRMGW